MNLKIKCDVGILLECLRVNMKKHSKDYEKAQSKYFSELLTYGIEIQESAKDHIMPDIKQQNLPSAPINYLEEYEKAISMLEFCENKEIELNSTDYQAFVKDSWSWSAHLISSNSKYL